MRFDHGAALRGRRGERAGSVGRPQHPITALPPPDEDSPMTDAPARPRLAALYHHSELIVVILLILEVLFHTGILPATPSPCQILSKKLSKKSVFCYNLRNAAANSSGLVSVLRPVRLPHPSEFSLAFLKFRGE